VGLGIIFLTFSYGFLDIMFGLPLSSSGGGDGYEILLLIPLILIGILVFIVGLVGLLISKLLNKN